MTKSTGVKLAVAFFMLIVALAAVAADGATSLSISTPLQLNGKKIDAGDYKVTWTGKDENVQVTFSNGKGPGLTVPAKLVEKKTVSPYTAVVRENDKVKEILLNKKKAALVFSE